MKSRALKDRVFIMSHSVFCHRCAMLEKSDEHGFFNEGIGLSLVQLSRVFLVFGLNEFKESIAVRRKPHRRRLERSGESLGRGLGSTLAFHRKFLEPSKPFLEAADTSPHRHSVSGESVVTGIYRFFPPTYSSHHDE